MDDPIEDKRFTHVDSDPRFKCVKKSERKIKIDKRFQSVFTDKKFQLKYAVDIRGRPVRETQADNYKKYYDLSSESESDDSIKSEESEVEKIELTDNGSKCKEIILKNELDPKEETVFLKKKKDKNKLLSKEIDEEHKVKINDEIHGKLKDMTTDYARGIGTIESDSSSDDSSSDESESIFVEHPWGELDKDAESTEEATRRIAICHLDWDRVYAKDLMVLLHSFLPADGIIESVTVYPSEFGLERMKEEEFKGPKELVEVNDVEDNKDENEDAEGKSYHMEKLREYQLNRLKYYYAIVVCNNVDTANKLYTTCNDLEYESCAAKLDMRFVDDDMTFDHEPREVCTSLPDLTKYKPRLFENSALRQGKVTLTWDETDPRRIEFNKRATSGDNVNDDDINNYIAGSTEESEEDSPKINADLLGDIGKNTKEKLAKYRSIIAGLKSEEEKKKNKDVEMEISWGVGIKSDRDRSKGKNIKEEQEKTFFQTRSNINSGSDSDINEMESNAHSLTDEDDSKYISTSKKKKTKRNNKSNRDTFSSEDESKKAELELLLTEDVLEENTKQHFSLKAIQKHEKDGKAKKKKWRKELKKKIKSNKEEEDNFKIDVADSRFSALYTSHLYNIDPAHPQYKKTKAMEEFIAEKQKRRKLSDKQ